VGRPSHKPVVRYKSFLYQAASWTIARRVVAKVEFHCGELFPRVGFVVTDLALDNRAAVRFYNKLGTAEQWIKESEQTVAMTPLSCHRFRADAHPTCALLLVAAGRRASDAAVVCRYAAEDRGAAVAGRIRRAQSRADFGDDAEAQVEVCENLVGEATVSGIFCQREAELARCGWVESPFDSKQRSNFPFAKLPVSVRV
jgi:hypothetical protein